MSLSDSWCSPPEITLRLEEFYEGPVEVDPCSNPRSIVKAIVAMTSGGLILPWRLPARKYPRAKGTGYENPPYSQNEVWTAKMLAELAKGNLREHIRLTMFASSAEWWANMCYKPRRNPRILALRRLAFLDPRCVFKVGEIRCEMAGSGTPFLCDEHRTARGAHFTKKAPKKAQGLMSCRFEPALTYFGPRWQRFDRVFAALTRWSTWGRT